MAPVAPTLAELGLPGDAGKKRVARAKKLVEMPEAKLKSFREARRRRVH